MIRAGERRRHLGRGVGTCEAASSPQPACLCRWLAFHLISDGPVVKLTTSTSQKMIYDTVSKQASLLVVRFTTKGDRNMIGDDTKQAGVVICDESHHKRTSKYGRRRYIWELPLRSSSISRHPEIYKVIYLDYPASPSRTSGNFQYLFSFVVVEIVVTRRQTYLPLY